MNPTNFNWLSELTPNENGGGINLPSLGMESNDLATNDIGGEQDIVKYLFDNTQFSMPLDPLVPQVTSPQSVSSNGNNTTDSDSPKSTTLTTMNHNNVNTFPAFDSTWLTSVDTQNSFKIIQTSTAPHTTAPQPPLTANNSNSRKMRIKKKREPIFVTESPQNAYKKKNKKSSATGAASTSLTLPPIDEKDQQQHQQQDSSSPSSHFDDEDDMDINESLDKQNLTSKEKRQLRNKISARNFRVRRKEYITQLENKVDEQEDEIDSLKQDNKRLTGLNEQLLQEVMELRLQLQQSSVTQHQPRHYQQQQPALTVSPSSSDTSSPPDFMESLLDFNLFNSNGNNITGNNYNLNTYLSHSLMPSFDLSHILGDKLAHPPSSTNLEEHRELMTVYPLLAPALASIVIRHTFTLHYAAYLTNTFPYDSNATRPKNEVLDIMHPDDWIAAASSTLASTTNKYGDDDPDNDKQNNLVPSHLVERRKKESFKSPSKSYENDTGDTWSRELERNILREHYPYYALMRLRGFSHEKIMRRCQACMEHRLEVERQRRLKGLSSCSKFQTLHAFTSVASALIRTPSRSPMIAGVIQESKACHVGSKYGKNKATLMMTAPLRAALRIGGGKS